MQSGYLQRLHTACQVARSAGALALDYFEKRDELDVSSKGLQDRVTLADQEVERHIFEKIIEAFPDDGFLGEEMASGEPVKLVEEGTRRGRSARPKLKVGICGEHGGEPASVEFCHRIGLDYVSCSPYRVPVARLAAAHAALKEKINR